MYAVEFDVPSSFVFEIQEPEITFNLEKVQRTYDNYTIHYHAGLTMVMGHPFEDATFCKLVAEEQKAIQNVFSSNGLQDLLVLYDIQTQVHATLIELAFQHDKERIDQQLLTKEELAISSKTNNCMNINYAAEWIKKTAPFDIEIGSGVLSEEDPDQPLGIKDTGQIVIKGRTKGRRLLADFRAEFESEAGIIHRYGKDDHFYFVVG